MMWQKPNYDVNKIQRQRRWLKYCSLWCTDALMSFMLTLIGGQGGFTVSCLCWPSFKTNNVNINIVYNSSYLYFKLGVKGPVSPERVNGITKQKKIYYSFIYSGLCAMIPFAFLLSREGIFSRSISLGTTAILVSKPLIFIHILIIL